MPNGDVYACDLDVIGLDFRMGSLYSESIADICSMNRLDVLHQKVRSGLELRGCTKCSLVAYCGLTCPRHTFSTRDHSPYCFMMENLVSHVKNRLNELSHALYDEPIEFEPERHPSLWKEVELKRPELEGKGSN